MHGNASAGGAMTRALDIGRSATDVGRWRASGCRIIFAGNILRPALRDQRWGHPLERPSCSARTGRESGVQKREAPAVAGPGLSCRGVTTILADRDVAP